MAPGLGPNPNKGGGVPFGAVFIGGVPVTINGVYPVIGGN